MQVNKKDFRSCCSINCSMEILGDKWTLLIIRDALLFGSSTYKEFSKNYEGIASNILSDRLEKLVTWGLFTKEKSESNKLVNIYKPTPIAEDLMPVLLSLNDWANKYIQDTGDLRQYLKEE